MVAIDEDKTLVFEERIVLPVKKGSFGLRQSDAFFHHVKNLPELYHRCLKVVDKQHIKVICVSDQPRQIEGSYMPVFTAGVHLSSLMSDSLGCPLMTLSHQENHLYAVAYEHKLPQAFIGVHISGGTSEILKVSFKDKFSIELIGHTLDLSFGKLIDRIGVYMGLDFPSGQALDALRSDDLEVYKLKLSIKALTFNISGFENKLKAYYDQDKNKVKIANTLFYYTALILEEILKSAQQAYDIHTFVISGGVSANSYIREHLRNVFKENVIFPKVKYATDHALGNAYYGRLMTHD